MQVFTATLATEADTDRVLAQQALDLIPEPKRSVLIKVLEEAISKQQLDSLALTSVVSRKMTYPQFVLKEAWAYIYQFLVFLLVAVMSSNLLKDDHVLGEMVARKIPHDLWDEFWWTIIAVLAIGATTWFVTKALLQRSDDVVREVMKDLPRTVYLFGSSFMGASVAIAWYLFGHPNEKTGLTPASLLGIALLFGVVFFLLGCVLSYALNKENITKQ